MSLALFDQKLAELRALFVAGSPAPAPSPVPAPPPLASSFYEDWAPRTPETGVFGVVASPPLQSTPDNSDPEQTFDFNTITGRWGTLMGLDRPGVYDVTGLGPNQHWAVQNNKLYFHANRVPHTDGFALISKQKFDRTKYLILKAPVAMAAGPVGSFVGLCLIAGEGDYREIALRRYASGDKVVLTAPNFEEVLVDSPGGEVELALHYVPGAGWGYFLNGVWLKTEPMAHLNAPLTKDPQIGLYMATTEVGTFVEGCFGPISCTAT